MFRCVNVAFADKRMGCGGFNVSVLYVCVCQLSLMCMSVWALAALLSLTAHLYSLCWTLGLSLYISAGLHPPLSDCRHECVCPCATWALVVYSPLCVWCCYSNTPHQSRLHGHSLAQHFSSLCALHILNPHLLKLMLSNFKRSLLPGLVCWCHNGRWLFVWADSFDWQFVSAHPVHIAAETCFLLAWHHSRHVGLMMDLILPTASPPITML